jgi:3-methyladenine DNA glycosylase AlkD
MTRPEQLAADIRRYCAAHADPAGAGKWARYFKEGYDAWGLLDPGHEFWNQRQQEWMERCRGIGVSGLLKLGEILFSSGKYEEGAMAIRLLAASRDRMEAPEVGRLRRWFAAGIGNWAHTDVLCGEVIAPLLAGGNVPLNTLARWRTSRWKYQRRAVPVAMLGLLKAGRPVTALLAFVRPLMHDSERVVHQGVGWFLREAWKKDPGAVEAFLAEYKDTAPRLIYQYATEKMSAAGKARFRAARRSPKRR